MPELWPFIPESVTETLAFRTDVLAAGTQEQRIALRNLPRQVLAFAWQPGEEELGAAEIIARFNPAGDWYVPFWPDAVYVGQINASETTILVDTLDRDYRDGGKIAIIQDYETAEVVDLTSAGGTSLALGGAVSQDYSTAHVVPVLTCYAPDGLLVDRERERFLTAEITFRARDEADLAASDWTQYEGLDVLDERSYATAPLSARIAQDLFVVDAGIGGVVLEKVKEYVSPRHTIRFEDETPADRYSRRQWLYSIKGKQKAFWVPTWNPDLTVFSNIGSSDTTITVERVDGVDVLDGRHIMLETTGGVRYYRQITNVASGATTTDLTISSSLGSAVATTEVNVLSLLNKCRSDADALQIVHEGNVRSSITIPLIEVP